MNQCSNDQKQQEFNKNKIQDINRAYNCLIKEDLRVAYDQSLQQQRSQTIHRNNVWNQYSSHETNDDFEEFYRQRRRRQYEDLYHYYSPNNSQNNRSNRYYYGFKTNKRIKNSEIVRICNFFIFLGFLLYFIQYKYSMNTLNHMNGKWQENGMNYKKIILDSE